MRRGAGGQGSRGDSPAPSPCGRGLGRGSCSLALWERVGERAIPLALWERVGERVCPLFTRRSSLVTRHSPQVFDQRLREQPPPRDLRPPLPVRRTFLSASHLPAVVVAKRRASAVPSAHSRKCGARRGRRRAAVRSHSVQSAKLPQPFLRRCDGRAENRQSTAIRRGNLRVQRKFNSLRQEGAGENYELGIRN